MMKRNTLVGPQLHQGGAKRFQVSAARALWLLVPIVIGAGAATQTLAHLLNYHSSLGPNLFHFYPPWSYFVWSYLWRHTNPSIFAQAFGVGVMAAIVSFLFFVLALSRSFRVNPFLHGSARWADERDIKAAGLLGNDGVYVGAWRDKRGDDPLPSAQRTRTCLVLRAHAQRQRGRLGGPNPAFVDRKRVCN